MTDEHTTSLADSAWPMIHCTPAGTKHTPLRGPTDGRHHIDHFQPPDATAGLVATIADDLVYYQTFANELFCLDAVNLTVKNSASLGVTFPYQGGNTVDDRGRVYLTRYGSLVRWNTGLVDPVESERLAPIDACYNGVAVMPDGNLLVTSSQFAHVVGTVERDGRLPRLSTTDLGAVAADGERLFAPSGFGPRPAYDASGGVYFCSEHNVVKLAYQPQIQTLGMLPAWSYRCPVPGASFALANPVLVGDPDDGTDQVWAAIEPPADGPMEVFCLDRGTGELLARSVPFPQALGASAAHTLGADPTRGLVVVICRSDDATGGIAAIDAATGDVRWRVGLPNISEAFCISSGSGRAYITSGNVEATEITLHAIGLDDGSAEPLHTFPSTIAPLASLPSIGPDGALFYPIVTALVRIQDRGRR